MKTESKQTQTLIRWSKALIIPVGFWLVFALLTEGRTANPTVLLNTFRQSVTASLICYGLMLNMKVGMLNFSVGAMMLFSGIVGGNLAKLTDTGIPGMFLFTVVICVLVGTLTGLLYNAMRVPCIVLTIGLMLVWESAPKLVFPNGLNLVANWTILSRSPYCFIILGVCLVLFYIIYNKLPFGHNLRAIGNNQAIANSVGLNSDKIKMGSFVLGAIFVGIAAFLYISERGEIRNVTALGSMNIMLDGFMGMFIALFLSKYCDMSVAVLLGTFTMKMMTNSFVAMGLSATARDIIQGFFLLILLTISANAGLLERRKADKSFAEVCNQAYAETHPGDSAQTG